jgi:hypothetical protein
MTTTKTLGSPSTASPHALGNKRDGQTAFRGTSARERKGGDEFVEMLVSDSVEVDKDEPGFAGGSKGTTVIPAQPGDKFTFEATVTTEGGVYAQLMLAPTVKGDSTGSAPVQPKKDLSGIRYGHGVYSPWRRGTSMPMRIEYTVPDQPEYSVINMYAGINKPNPPQFSPMDWPEEERGGTISWEGAKIERIPRSEQSTFSASSVLIAVGTAGAGYYAFKNLL